MRFGHASVLTREQNLALHLDAPRWEGREKIFRECSSGAKAERIQLDRLLEEVRGGDVIVIWRFDRLGRLPRRLVSLKPMNW